jgi:hypothetical protein
MAKATRVLSTPPTNTSANNPSGPVDQARRHLLTLAAGGAVAAAIPTAAMAAAPAVDPAFSLIAAKRAADVAHEAACDAYSEAEERYGVGSDEAEEVFVLGDPACHAAYEAGWPLATTPPNTLAGVVAVLRFANEIEDAGNKWPDSDTIGPEGWHHQLRATMGRRCSHERDRISKRRPSSSCIAPSARSEWEEQAHAAVPQPRSDIEIRRDRFGSGCLLGRR